MPTVTRAAFDVGSGRTKLLVADVDVVGGKLVKIHFGSEMPVVFKADVLASGEKQELSADIQEVGLQTLREMTEKAATLGAAPPYAGVATDVFRKARNGASFLERVRQEVQLDLSLVSQDEEATLGLLTAVALCPAASEAELLNVLAWDSGGGSFQVSNMAPNATVPRSYGGQWGSSVAWSGMIELVRGQTFAQQTTNPVSRVEADRLVALIRDDIAKTPTEAWLSERSTSGATVLIGIGGDTCIFRMVEQITGKSQQTLADVRAAIDALLNQTDAEVEALGLEEEYEYAVPKLCLMVAVIEHLKLPALHYQPAVGNTAGLLVHDTVMGVRKYWPAPGMDGDAPAAKRARVDDA